MWHFLQVFFNSAERERKFLLKNPWDFSVMVWIPLLTMGLVWWVFSRSVIVDVPIAVVNHSHGTASRTLIRYLDNSPDVKVVDIYSSEQQIKENILTRTIYGAIIIPHDFDKKIMQGGVSKVALQVNAQYGTHSGIIQKGVQKAIGTISAGIEINGLIKKGVSMQQANIDYAPIQIQRVSLFNKKADYQQFLASTVLPALLHILAMIIGATTVGREVRDRTIGDWYAEIKHGHTASTASQSSDLHKSTASGYNVLTILAGLQGKYIWPFLFFSIWGVICLVLGSQLHPASMGSWWLTFVAFLALMQISFWLGSIFTLLTFSLRKGLSATGFISAPSFAFAGVTYPLIALTSSAKKWALMLPLTHYLSVHIAQMQMNAPTYISTKTTGWLLVTSVILMFLSTLLMRRVLNTPARWGGR